RISSGADTQRWCAHRRFPRATSLCPPGSLLPTPCLSVPARCPSPEGSLYPGPGHSNRLRSGRGGLLCAPVRRSAPGATGTGSLPSGAAAGPAAGRVGSRPRLLGRVLLGSAHARLAGGTCSRSGLSGRVVLSGGAQGGIAGRIAIRCGLPGRIPVRSGAAARSAGRLAGRALLFVDPGHGRISATGLAGLALLTLVDVGHLGGGRTALAGAAGILPASCRLTGDPRLIAPVGIAEDLRVVAPAARLACAQRRQRQQGEQPEEQLELLRHVSHSPQFRCLPCTGRPVSGSRITLAGQRPIGAGGSEPSGEVTTPGK